MAGPGFFYWNEKLQRTVPQTLLLQWQITAAKTVAPLFQGLDTLTLFDAVSGQAAINSFLGTTDEFTAAQFDATSMGADAFGVIVNMKGQAAAVGALEVTCYSGTGGATAVTRAVVAAGLTASTLETAAALGSQGNLALKVDFGNTPDFDGLTSGLIVARLTWLPK